MTSLDGIKQFTKKLLLRPLETSHVLSVSPRKVWSLTASGELPHIRIGRCVRYSVDDLQAWIDQRKKGSDAK